MEQSLKKYNERLSSDDEKRIKTAMENRHLVKEQTKD